MGMCLFGWSHGQHSHLGVSLLQKLKHCKAATDISIVNICLCFSAYKLKIKLPMVQSCEPLPDKIQLKKKTLTRLEFLFFKRNSPERKARSECIQLILVKIQLIYICNSPFVHPQMCNSIFTGQTMKLHFIGQKKAKHVRMMGVFLTKYEPER